MTFDNALMMLVVAYGVLGITALAVALALIIALFVKTRTSTYASIIK